MGDVGIGLDNSPNFWHRQLSQLEHLTIEKNERRRKSQREREGCANSIADSAAEIKSVFSDSISRRRFLKGAGGATAGTMLALHGMKVEALAQGGYSAPKKVLIWEIKSCGNGTTHNGNSQYDTEEEAEAAGITAATTMLIFYNLATVSPNQHRAKQGNKKPCLEVEGVNTNVPVVEAVAVTPGDPNTKFKYNIIIPAGDVKFIYFK